MVSDYNSKYYEPAAQAFMTLNADNAATARKLVVEKSKLVANFDEHKLFVSNPVVEGNLEHLHVGDKIRLTVNVNLGGLQPDEVEVDAYSGVADAHNEIVEGASFALKMLEDKGGGNYVYGGEIECNASGRFGLTARIKAAGEVWDNSVPGFMCWPK